MAYNFMLPGVIVYFGFMATVVRSDFSFMKQAVAMTGLFLYMRMGYCIMQEY